MGTRTASRTTMASRAVRVNHVPMPALRAAASRSRPARRSCSLAVLLGVALASCDVPNFEGPQIQEPPQGFLLTPESYPVRRLVTDQEAAFHTAWVESVEDFSTIYVDGYRSVMGYEEALAARDSARRHATDAGATFGEVEPFTVDGRDGWGWAERVEDPRRGLVSVAYRAFVPYDSMTYVIDFSSGNPRYKRAAPDTLKAIIATFAVGRTTFNLPLIAIGGGLVLFGLAVVRSKRQERAARLRSINLVKIPKKEASPEPEAAAPPAAPPAEAVATRTAAPPAESPAPAAPRPYPDWRTPKPPSAQ